MELLLFTRYSAKIGFRLKPTFSHRLQYFAVRFLLLVIRLLPRRVRSTVGGLIGQLIYYIGIRRDVTEQNLNRAFPTLPINAIHEVSKRIYRHFGKVSTEFVELPGLGRKDLSSWLHVEGFDILDDVIRTGRGGIVISGHLGNWELMGSIASQCGYPVTFVVASQSNELIEKLINDFRRGAGIEIVKRREAIRGVLAALHRKRLVAFLIDQDAHEDGVFVPFFGTPASTPRGPAVFHLRTGAPLVFAQCARLPKDRYRIRFTRVSTEGCSNADEITARLSSYLEAAIRETPEQWFWMHRRWKTRPIES